MTRKTFTFADMDDDGLSDDSDDRDNATGPTREAGSAPVETPEAGSATPADRATRSARVREFANPRRHPLVAGIAALCIAAVVATVVLAVLYARSSSDLDSANALAADKRTAETDAGKYAVGAATFDFTDLGSWSASLKRGTAPELSSRFDVAAKTLTPLLQEVQWKQTANLIAAKTIDIRDGRQYVVQVFVSTKMTSTQNPTGLNTVTPYTVTLDRDDNWTITDVAGIDGTPQDRSTGSGVPNLGAAQSSPSQVAPAPASPAPASNTPPAP